MDNEIHLELDSIVFVKDLEKSLSNCELAFCFMTYLFVFKVFIIILNCYEYRQRVLQCIFTEFVASDILPSVVVILVLF